MPWLFSLVLFAPFVLPLSVAQRSAATPDFAHDFGVPVSDVKPLAASIPAATRERVAEHAGLDAKELAGIQLFTGTIGTGKAARAEDLVFVPLGGAAKGGRIVFSATKGCAKEMGLWGALDFDDDPTLRWGIFVEQLRIANTHETGAGVDPVSLAMEPAREIEARLAEVRTAKDEESRLTDALLRQRMAMRRNEIWVGMFRRGKERPPYQWMEELAGEMEELAKLSPVLEPVLGKGSTPEHAKHARDLAAVYRDMADLLKDDPMASVKEFEGSLRPICGGCHSKQPDGSQWEELARQRRHELELTGSRLTVGFDVAATIGDHEGVSKEIADKVRAGLLLLEATKK